jgi:hypothetical protein
MSYTTYTPGCDEDIPDHICNTCGDDKEGGRVRSIAYIKRSFLATLLVDPANPTIWLQGIASKDIIIIPEVLGSFDGGSPVMGPGYGDSDEELIGYKFGVAYKDPNYKLNAPFYDSIKNSRNYVVAFRTETQVHIADKTSKAIPKNPVTEDLNSEVVWDVNVSFSQPNVLTPVDTPEGIFECFAYES